MLIQILVAKRYGKTQLTFDNGIHWTALLAETTIYALRHVNVVSRRPSATIFTLFSLDCDSLSWTDGFAKLACNASFFPRRIPSQCMFSSESWTDWALLEWVVNRVTNRKFSNIQDRVESSLRWSEELFHKYPHASCHLCQ